MRSTRMRTAKAKSLFKVASVRQPEAIASLRRSLSISHSNLLEFISSINEYGDAKIKKMERTRNKERVIAQEQALRIEQESEKLANIRNQGVLLRKKVRNRKTIKQQMKIKKNNLKLQLEEKSLRDNSFNLIDEYGHRSYKQAKISPHSKYQFVSPSEKNYNWQFAAKTNKHRQLSETIRSRVKTERRVIASTLTNRADRKGVSSTQKFWRKTGNGWGNINVKHCITEQSEYRKGSRTLSELTQFSPNKNRRAINFLALQFQVNLQCEKHSRLDTTK